MNERSKFKINSKRMSQLEIEWLDLGVATRTMQIACTPSITYIIFILPFCKTDTDWAIRKPHTD